MMDQSDDVFKFEADQEASEASLVVVPNGLNFQYERADWVLFRSINTLPRKVGVSADKLRRLVLKELADNALDICASVRVGLTTPLLSPC